MAKRPWRSDFFGAIVAELESKLQVGDRILELGSGPGFLAEQLLQRFAGISYVLLDFSPAMHELARERLTPFGQRVDFLTRDFRESDWYDGLGLFDAVVTFQAVHELRHKRYATALHSAVRPLLVQGQPYLVCDHFAGAGGMSDNELYMSIDDQQTAIRSAGFCDVRLVMLKGGMGLHYAA